MPKAEGRAARPAPPSYTERLSKRKSLQLEIAALDTRGKRRNLHAREETIVTESSGEASLAAMTAEIVSAYVSHNQIATAELAGLISASVRPDHLVCLICGKKQKVLKPHLALKHGLTPDQDRETFGLQSD